MTAKGTGNYNGFIADNSSSSTIGGGYYAAYSFGIQRGIFGVAGAISGTTDNNIGIFAEGGLGIKFFVNGSATASHMMTSGGNVLIGTTTDAGYKLDVNGSGRFIGNLEFGSMTIFNGNALGTRTVTTSPVTLQTTSQFGGGNTGNLSLVSGIIQGNGGIGFIDIVLWMYGGSTPTVISSQTTGGPAGRTYSISASANLQLTMASGTYFVSSNTFRQSYTN